MEQGSDLLLMIWAPIMSQLCVTISVFKVGCLIRNLVGRVIAPVSTDFSLGALPSHPSNWRSNCIPCIGDSDGGVDLNLNWKEGAAPRNRKPFSYADQCIWLMSYSPTNLNIRKLFKSKRTQSCVQL